jgi:hypothetical protein
MLNIAEDNYTLFSFYTLGLTYTIVGTFNNMSRLIRHFHYSLHSINNTIYFTEHPSSYV